MRPSRSGSLTSILLVVVLVITLSPRKSHGQVSVTTQHNDNWRTGQNTSETVLTTSNVNKTTFGLLCKISLISAPQQEQAYAQPLIVANGSGGMTAYVATMQDRIYAVSIPANWNGSCSTLATISRNLLDGFPNESAADCNHLGGGGCTIIAPSVGVLGTPVIDTSTGTLYVVAESQSPPFPQTPTAWYHRIHALDVTTLAEKATSSPATIQPAQIGNAIFVSQQLIQRPGLLFLGPAISPTSPTVYVGFSMMDGTTPNPSGWVLAFDGGNLGLGGFPLAYATTSGQADSNNRHGGGAWTENRGQTGLTPISPQTR